MLGFILTFLPGSREYSKQEYINNSYLANVFSFVLALFGK